MIKFVLTSFELASKLRLNFSKIFINGVNRKVFLMELAQSFSNCITGSLPFKYFWLPVEANPKKTVTSKPLNKLDANRS